MKKGIFKWFFVLILVVFISLIIYNNQNKTDGVQNNSEINGVIKEAIGKPSMYGDYYLQIENSSNKIFLEEKSINLDQYLDKDVIIKGYFSDRKLECLPNLQCGSEKYQVFVIEELTEKDIIIEGELYIEPKTGARYMVNGYWLIDGDDKLKDFVGKKLRVSGKVIESECDELDRLYPERKGMLQCMTGSRLQVKEVAII